MQGCQKPENSNNSQTKKGSSRRKSMEAWRKGFTGQISTQSLFKPNPNFALQKQKSKKRNGSSQKSLMRSDEDYSSKSLRQEQPSSSFERFEASGRQLDSFQLVNNSASLRNHFCQQASMQSLLKSISKDEDSAQIFQQLPSCRGAKTPGLGPEELLLTESGTNSVKKGASGSGIA